MPTPQGVSTCLLVINTLTLASISVIVRQPCILAIIAASFILSQAVGQPAGRGAAVVVDDDLEDVASALKVVVFGQDQGMVFGVWLSPLVDKLTVKVNKAISGCCENEFHRVLGAVSEELECVCGSVSLLVELVG